MAQETDLFIWKGTVTANEEHMSIEHEHVFLGQHCECRCRQGQAFPSKYVEPENKSTWLQLIRNLRIVEFFTIQTLQVTEEPGLHFIGFWKNLLNR